MNTLQSCTWNIAWANQGPDAQQKEGRGQAPMLSDGSVAAALSLHQHLDTARRHTYDSRDPERWRALLTSGPLHPADCSRVPGRISSETTRGGAWVEVDFCGGGLAITSPDEVRVVVEVGVGGEVGLAFPAIIAVVDVKRQDDVVDLIVAVLDPNTLVLLQPRIS
uniref:Uncharacterized protein n=1 Tax=Mycena chlorophos TaxID=658473 RepID=A0ABQ0L8U2_MYCCL|nr:predicted protein [Mycena chlorophos]